MRKRETVFFDIETGGLIPGKHPIIEIAAVATDDACETLDEFEAKLKFDLVGCDQQALEANSYSHLVWEREAIDPRDALNRFSDFLRRHATVQMVSKRGSPYSVAQLVGHNAVTFDGPHLQRWYKDNDEFLPGAFGVLCTVQLARWYFYRHPDSAPKDNRLETLCEHFAVDLPSAHDALSDARATVRVARAILRRLNLL